jgi:phage terminase large subunit-like protein
MVGGSEHHSLYADPRQHPQKKEESVLWTRNGGDRVEAILRNVDHAFAYKAVHASRGKLTQVEPIAALYEQHRVHHIGTFGLLEDQMCDYVSMASKSSDRMSRRRARGLLIRGRENKRCSGCLH